jgi:multicomponent Na+:H+ antiporter subunit B
LKTIAALISLAVGALLVTVISDLPDWGQVNSPANRHVSAYYLDHSLEHTKVPNVVTTVLADYRGFDTMFETGVVFVAVIGIMAILRKSRREQEAAKPKAPYFPPDTLILPVASRLIVPFMQLFALYVVAHGHHSPGGGFQGGVILGASLILMAMTNDLPAALKLMGERTFVLLAALGFGIYSSIGLACLFLGGNFLDYSVLSAVLPATDAIMARYHGMLGVEIGVALTVMSSMFAIYCYLSSDGRLDQGL